MAGRAGGGKALGAERDEVPEVGVSAYAGHDDASPEHEEDNGGESVLPVNPPAATGPVVFGVVRAILPHTPNMAGRAGRGKPAADR